MINSIRNNSPRVSKFWVLCLDDETFKQLEHLKREDLELVKIENFSDKEVLALREVRAWREFCWTLAASFLHSIIEQSSFGTIVAYVDADCYFFSDLTIITDELSSSNQILIHEHRFSPDRLMWEKASGRFNVGVVAGIVGDQFNSCISTWRAQVIAECVLDPENGKCGDQTYLNTWPDKYTQLRIMPQKGAGVGPWNMANYTISQENKEVKVDEENLIFFHFSRFKIVRVNRIFSLYICAEGYEVPKNFERIVYRKYAKSLTESRRKLTSSYKHSWGIEKLTTRKKIILLNRKMFKLTFCPLF
jgi:hypothetical protein